MKHPQPTVEMTDGMADIENCPRCLGVHKDVVLISFENPVALGSNPFIFWGTCPVTGAPILFRDSTSETSFKLAT